MANEVIKGPLWPKVSSLKELLGLLVCVFLGAYAAIVPFFVNPRFFFNDDEQNLFYAYFIDIGQHLRLHQWPGITLSTFYGGCSIDDWQFGLLNPFSLLIYAIVCSMQNLPLLGLVLSGIYLISLALGGYCLGRAFKLRRVFALSLSACLVTNNFLQYMYCDSWISGLISFTWFIWAWVLLEQYRNSGNSWTLGGLTCLIYLTITSGWPHAMLMLAVLMCVYFVELVLIQRLKVRAFKLAGINIGAFLLTAPFLFPALFSFSWMCRTSGIHSSGLLMPDFGSVLNLSSIFLFPRIHLYAHEYPSYPMMFLAWFIMPLLPLCSWQLMVDMFRKRLGLVVFAFIGAVMLFGPESIGPIRYPIRFIPFVHLVILLSFFLYASLPQAFQITKTRLAGVIGISLLQFTSSVSSFPDTLDLQMLSSGLSLVAILCAVRLLHFNNFFAVGIFFIAGTIVVFTATHIVDPRNQDMVDFGAPARNNVTLPTAAKPFSGYQLFIGPMLYDNSKDARLAAQGIYDGEYTINGYTSLGHVGVSPKTHGYCWFEVRDDAGVDFLLSREPTTNMPLLSLMRVNRLLVFNSYLEHARPLLGKDWIPVSKGVYATVLENSAPNFAATTLSYASEGIEAKPLGLVTGENEKLQVTAEKGGQLVFARLYWPGYQADLNGKPVDVSALGKLFVKLDLPPGSQGELTLSFVPPGWKLGLFLAALGSVLCIAVFWMREGSLLPSARVAL